MTITGIPEYIKVTQTFPDIETTSEIVLTRNTNRRYLFLQNLGNKDIFVKFGGDPAIAEECILVPAGGFYEPLRPPYEEVRAISVSGTNRLIVLEGT